jgi:hypothetical protein
VAVELRRRRPGDDAELSWFHGDTLRHERVTLDGRERAPDAPGTPITERTRTHLVRRSRSGAEAAYTDWLTPLGR